MKRKKSLIIFGSVILLLLVAAGLFFSGVFRSWGTLIDCSMPYTYEQLLEQCPVVVRGKVVGGTRNVRVDNGDGDDWLYTEYTLKVTEVLRGEVQVGERLPLRIDGGYTWTYQYDCETCPEIRRGETAVAFLHRLDGQEYYRIQGGKYSGWYTVAEGDTLQGYGETTKSYLQLCEDIKIVP